MADVLSQDEINNLLGSIESGEVETEELQSSEKEHSPAVRIVDFVRPNILTVDEISIIQVQARQLMRQGVGNLSSLLGEKVEWDITSLDILTLDEFCRCQANPSAIFYLDFGLPAMGVLSASAQSVLSLLYVFMGLGDSLPTDFSELDNPSVERSVFALFSKAFKEPLQNFPLSGSIKKISIEPTPHGLSDPLEMVLVSHVEFTIPQRGIQGSLSLVIPRDGLDILKSGGEATVDNAFAASGNELGELLHDRRIQYNLVLSPEKVKKSLKGECPLSLIGDVSGSIAYEPRGNQ